MATGRHADAGRRRSGGQLIGTRVSPSLADSIEAITRPAGLSKAEFLRAAVVGGLLAFGEPGDDERAEGH